MNTIEVVQTSQFDGTAFFGGNQVFRLASELTGFTIHRNTQSGNNVGNLPDLGATVTDTFVFENFSQTLSGKRLNNAKVNAVYDYNNNIALNIVSAAGSDATNLSVFQFGGSTGTTVFLNVASGLGSDVNIKINPAGSGVVSLAGLTFPAALGPVNYALISGTSGALEFAPSTAPSESTFTTGLGSNATRTLTTTLTDNSVMFFNVYLVGSTGITTDSIAEAFQLKTAYARTGATLHAVGAPTVDDVLQFRDDATVSISTSASNPSTVNLSVIGSSSATINWKLQIQTLTL